MTKQEASEKYNIPISILDEYENWRLCQEVKKVMDTKDQRLRMLNKRRSDALDEIHWKEEQLERLDYLRHNVKVSQEKS